MFIEIIIFLEGVAFKNLKIDYLLNKKNIYEKEYNFNYKPSKI